MKWCVILCPVQAQLVQLNLYDSFSRCQTVPLSNFQPTGLLCDAIPDPMQQQVVQTMLEKRAVPNTTNYFSSEESTEEEKEAINEVVKKGWCEPYGLSSHCWQLSMVPLKSVGVRFGLRNPLDVFTRRSGTPLQGATTFELILELKHTGWNQKDIPETKQSKSQVRPFKPGFLVTTYDRLFV